jgi:hypothetical protein
MGVKLAVGLQLLQMIQLVEELNYQPQVNLRRPQEVHTSWRPGRVLLLEVKDVMLEDIAGVAVIRISFYFWSLL